MENREIARISFLRILILGLVLPIKRLRMTIFRFCLRTFSSLKVTMHTSTVRSLFVLALTSSHSSSSPGVESNQKNFDLIRTHQTHLLVRRHEVRNLVTALIALIGCTQESHQLNSANSSLVGNTRFSS